MENQTLEKTLLLDFYGDLLTDKQREYYNLYHNSDFSLAEIADRAGITRQGVYDIIRRADRTLSEIEEKTGLIERWRKMRKAAGEAKSLIENLQSTTDEKKTTETTERLISILDDIIEDIT